MNILILLCLVLLTGCEYSAHADSKTQMIDASAIFEQLQQARESDEKRDLQLSAIREDIAHVALAVDGLAQRLDHPQDTVQNAVRISAEVEPPRDDPLDWSQSLNATCFKLDGVDIDLEQYLSEWTTANTEQVTWDGDRDSLIEHLLKHKISDVNQQSLETLNRLHTAVIEQEIDEGLRPDHVVQARVVPPLAQSHQHPSLGLHAQMGNARNPNGNSPGNTFSRLGRLGVVPIGADNG